MELNNVRIQSKKDTTANWESINPILLDGEIGIEETTDGNFKIKIGDGEKTWSLLPYIKSDTNGGSIQAYNFTLINNSWSTGVVSNEAVSGMYTQEITVKTFESNDKVDILIPPSLYNSIPCGIYTVNISGKVYAATEFPPDINIDVQILVSKISIN